MSIIDIHFAKCPACGKEKLHLMPGGNIHCLAKGCPQPEAAYLILRDGELEHIVHIEHPDGSWTIKHPLRERINDGLFNCIIPALIYSEGKDEGYYRVLRDDNSPDGVFWQRIEGM